MFDDLNDFLRNGALYFVVLFILCGPALADSNFAIKRMVIDFSFAFNFINEFCNNLKVQYEVSGQTYGSRASALNMEAKALNTEVKGRSCILTR